MFFKKRLPPEQEFLTAVRSGSVCLQMEENSETLFDDRMVKNAVKYSLREGKFNLPKDQIKVLEMAVYAFMGEGKFIKKFMERQKMGNDLIDQDDLDEGMKVLEDSVAKFTKSV